jgi:intracellular sulfur oxidation DsrE/DsrF family protein
MFTNRWVAMITAVAVIAAAGAAMKTRLLATPDAAAKVYAASDQWLTRIDAPHKQFFDAPQPEGGIPLLHVMNYYDTYNTAYGVQDADVDAVLTFYGGTTFFGVNDAMWRKYGLGEFLGVSDPATGKPAVRNTWNASPVILGFTLPGAGIEALHARGATFIVCNNALQIFGGLVAAKRGLDTAEVYEDLRANLLPSVDLVPGMVIAVEQAQRAGMTYHRE